MNNINDNRELGASNSPCGTTSTLQKDSLLKSTPVRRPFTLLQNKNLCVHSRSTIPRNKLSQFFQIQEEQNQENCSPSINRSKTSKTLMFTPPSTWGRSYINSSINCNKVSVPSIVMKPSPAITSDTNTSSCSRLGDKQPHPQTPQQSLYNPFECPVEGLAVPTVSPSLFREVVSPSDTKGEQSFWSLEQMARLHPAFTEVSPRHLTEYPITADPESECRMQEAIEKYFNNYTIVPSPWTDNSSKGTSSSPNSNMDSPFYTNFKTSKSTVWCQTELTLPPVLPPNVEEALAPFITFNQNQSCQNNEDNDESTSLNNTTLRRKLLFNNEDTLNCSQMQTERSSSTSSSGDSTQPSISCPVSDIPEDEDDDDLILPWCGSMIHVSTEQQRFIPSPDSTNKPNTKHIECKAKFEELSPVKLSFNNPISASPPLSPIKSVSVGELSHDSLIKDEEDISSLEKEASQDSVIDITEQDMSTSQLLSSHCHYEDSDGITEQMRHNSNSSSISKVTPIRHFGCFNRHHKELSVKCKKKLSVCDDMEVFSNDVDVTTVSSPLTSSTSSTRRPPSSYGTPSSAQFSSSPIKTDCIDIWNNIKTNTPSKLSTSPPVSPIPWRMGTSTLDQLSQSQSLPLLEDNDDAYITSNPVMLNMDTDSQPFIEASYLEDGNSQDTGYISTIGPLSQLSQTSDTFTNLKTGALEKINSISNIPEDMIS